MPKSKPQRGEFIPDDEAIIEAVADIGVALTTDVVRHIAQKQPDFDKPVTDARSVWRREEDRLLDREAIGESLGRLAMAGALVAKHGGEIPPSGPQVRRNRNWTYFATPENWQAILTAQVAHAQRERQEVAEEQARLTLAQRHPAEYEELVSQYLAEQEA